MHLQIDDSIDWLNNSWNRSSEAGLKENRLPDDIRLERFQLSERRDSARKLISGLENYALPLFNQMFAKTNSRLILTDVQGVILGSWGQEQFACRLTSIALENGVCWQEKLKGTNAIGTAIIEEKPISIIGNQHFINQHRFISCSASPIFDHNGKMLGILDITSEQQVHQSNTQLLIQSMIQKIENSLLFDIPNGTIRVDIACDQTLLDSGWQGIVIANEAGDVIAHNQLASQLLDQQEIIGAPLEHLLEPKDTPFVYRLHPQSTKTIPKSVTYSPSSELHQGDERIENAWQQACKVIDNQINLLILGETGVGKGEFVKALHKQSKRKKYPLVIVNCGALPKDLIESELFGYAPGAFTGASNKGFQGKIRQADKGILFLDEIADMPLEAQCRLLHVLQEKEVVPVGSNQSHNVDIQIIAATHKNIEQLIAEGSFRQDLYYRLNGLVFHLPSLRERKDKAALIKKIHKQHCKNEQVLDENLLDLLERFRWPGNIRELDNVLHVATLLSSDEPVLKLKHIPDHISKSLISRSNINTLERRPFNEEKEEISLRETVEDTLIKTYRANNGNISKTSKILSISRNTIYRKLKKLGVLPN
ncbi:sigma-54-dependent Fis family transcriptional regulator [Vibrio algarum]|uniref:Sigma-54-dependent Fis family transcriptional regulator n=1 Tax=Vibrio algarum TaxID=3020714 RepID=A0ABT4YR55_9VIBR|nr:sigma-54-dependent Fis family transcriptional regulator [Vibrio sp. KJ40-1]MDB1124039.1 sigma-54-dependent Fis family transcriptional regulator [Vibrio sp. KJ40-1]